MKLGVFQMLSRDKNDLQEGVNEFQRQLMANPAFRNIIAPVTFQENESKMTLPLVRQLAQVSEGEFVESRGGAVV